VTYMGEKGVHISFWSRKHEEEVYLGELGVDGIMILKCIFKKWNGLES